MNIFKSVSLILTCMVSIFTECNTLNPLRYTCYKTNQQIVIDGIINDFPWNKAPWSAGFVDIRGNPDNKPEFETMFKMLWDESCLYIAAYIEEPHIWATLTQRESVIFHDNDFEVFIDPDNDGLNYYEFEINAFGTEWDLLLTRPYSEKGKPDNSWNIKGIRSAVGIYGTINNPEDTDSAWTVEIAMPWESLLEYSNTNNIPTPGDSWRMNFSRVEWHTKIVDSVYIKKTNPLTGKNLPEENWVWSPQGEINMHIPQKWGYVFFSDSIISNVPELWVWMGANKNYSLNTWDSVCRILSDARITGLLLGADTGILKMVIPLAEKYGIDVYAWFWTMNRHDAKPEWLSYNRNGKSLSEEKAYVDYYKFMCPALPEVKNFLTKKINDLAHIQGLKGINLDYIRYVDAILPEGLQPAYGLKQDTVLAAFDYGYHPYMRDIFRNKHGYDPLKPVNKTVCNAQWHAFRLDQLNQTVDLINRQIRNNGLIPTAAVFPTPSMSARMVLQSWDQWNLACYFPMVYHNFYNKPVSWIKLVMLENRSVMPSGAKIFCGLYLPALKSNHHLTEAMQAAYEGGADGVAFFDFNALDTNCLKQIKDFKFAPSHH